MNLKGVDGASGVRRPKGHFAQSACGARIHHHYVGCWQFTHAHTTQQVHSTIDGLTFSERAFACACVCGLWLCVCIDMCDEEHTFPCICTVQKKRSHHIAQHTLVFIILHAAARSAHAHAHIATLNSSMLLVYAIAREHARDLTSLLLYARYYNINTSRDIVC